LAVPSSEQPPDHASLINAMQNALPPVRWRRAPPPPDALTTLKLPKLPRATVTARAHDDPTGTDTLTLSNGITVLLKPTRFEPGAVRIFGTRRGGLDHVPNVDYARALVAQRLMPQSGTSLLSDRAFQAALAELGSSAQVSLGSATHTASATSQTAMLPLTLKALYLLMRYPGPRPDFTYTDDRLRGMVRAPDVVAGFAQAINTILTGDEQRPPVFTEELIKRTRFPEAVQYWTNLFGHAEGFTFALVGDFDVATAEGAVIEYLGALPGGKNPLGKAFHTHRWQQTQRIQVQSPDTRSFNQIWLGFYAQKAESETARQDALLLERVVGNRLFGRLREEAGLIYNYRVDAGIVPDTTPLLTLHVQTRCSPADVEAVKAQILAELRSLAEEGPTEEELVRVRGQLRRGIEADLRNNSWWAEELAARGDTPGAVPPGDVQAQLERATARRVQLLFQSLRISERHHEVTSGAQGIVGF